jgi:hypothetical protein
MRDRSVESASVGQAVAAGSPGRALVLATISFALSFAAWGLIGGLASVFAGLYSLTASQTALLVAVPVLLGSLARLPMGMLTDRFGGRLVFTALLAFSSLAALVVPLTGRSGDQSVVGHGRDRRDLGRRLECCGVLADYDELHLAGARAGREGRRPGPSHYPRRAHLRSVPRPFDRTQSSFRITGRAGRARTS